MPKRKVDELLSDGEIKSESLSEEAEDASQDSSTTERVNEESESASDNGMQTSYTQETPSISANSINLEKLAGEPPRKKKKGVCFKGVTVYYFPRIQGFTCVPSQGGSTLGMDTKHCYTENFTLQEHADFRKNYHRNYLLQRRTTIKHPTVSDSDESEEVSDISDSELEGDSCYFLQPVPIRQRRAMLRASGIRKIDSYEKEDCRDIRVSREFCGCECKIYCDPETCMCSLAGIKCQVDRLSFPCGCSRDGCGNLNGRIEFNPIRVRTHFIHTLMRLELEKKRNEPQETEAISQSSSDSSYVTSESSDMPNYDCSKSSNFETCSWSSMPVPFRTTTTVASTENKSVAVSNCTSCTEISIPTTLSFGDSESDFLNRDNSVDKYASPFSPEESSYSENSEYSTDDFDSEQEEHHSVAVNGVQEYPINNPSNANIANPSNSNSVFEAKIPTATDYHSHQVPFDGSYGKHFANNLTECNNLNAVYPDKNCRNGYFNNGVTVNPHFTNDVQKTIQYMPKTEYAVNTRSNFTATLNGSLEHTAPNSAYINPTPVERCISPEEQKYTDLSSATPTSKFEPLSSLLSSTVQQVIAIKPVTVIPGQNEMLLSMDSSSLDKVDSSTSRSTSEGELSDEPSENFGEIIKKTMVESVAV